MKVSGGMKEGGIVVGNTYNKYGSKNPIVRWIMTGFEHSLESLVKKVGPNSIHEVGCGEGYWVLHWAEMGIESRGSDFSSNVIALAQENARVKGGDPKQFEARSIYDLKAGRDSADLVVCCEVLEHLEQPRLALGVLQKVVDDYLIVSVPREPLWCVLNLLRGKYITTLGNTPGHIQHWSKSGFIQLISEYFEVVETNSPLPWTMLLCRRRRNQ